MAITIEKEDSRVETKQTMKTNEKRFWLFLGIGIVLISAVRFFYGITGDYFTFLDEYITYDTAVGFTNTGKFYLWDFLNDCLTDQSYTRAWPHTVLLALWFKIFGISVVNGKIFSAVLGVLFILSVFWITRKLYESYFVSILSCLFLLGNETVVTSFRQIRMYGPWLLVMIWLYYFFYMTVTREYVFSSENRVLCWFDRNFNYSWFHAAAAVALLAISCFVHVNTLIAGIGMLSFFIYCMLSKRHPRYGIALGGAAFAAGVYLFLEAEGILNSSILNLIHAYFKILEKPNIKYYTWIKEFTGYPFLFLISLLLIIICFLKKRKDRDDAYDFSLYGFLTAASSLICFVTVCNRYYQDRYMVYIAPFIAILMAWGIVEGVGIFEKKCTVVFVCAASVLLMFHMVAEFTLVYHNPDICYHTPVFQMIREDAGEKPIAIAGFDLRDNYGVPVLGHYARAVFDRKNDIKILLDFAEEHPEGYLSVETAKINGVTDGLNLLMQKYSEKITGEGLDSWNVEVCRYHILYPVTEDSWIRVQPSTDYSLVSYGFEVLRGETELRIDIDISRLPAKAEVMYLKFGIFTIDKETEEKCYQLVLPEERVGVASYNVTMDKECQVVQLYDDYGICNNDETCQEKKVWQ